VRKAVAATALAASVRGDKRAGVVWHTCTLPQIGSKL